MSAKRILTGWGAIYIEDADILPQDRLPMMRVTWAPNDQRPARCVQMPRRVWEQLESYFAQSAGAGSDGAGRPPALVDEMDDARRAIPRDLASPGLASPGSTEIL